MGLRWVEQVTGSLEEKKRYRQYKARTRGLSASYRTAIDGVERYLMYAGSIVRGDVLVLMLEDMADLFEESAATATPVREIVGEDPVEFAEAFLRNYSQGQWVNKERQRLADAIERAASQERGGEGSPSH